jgi:uncharacterized repeat protein (TIGR01451 family)
MKAGTRLLVSLSLCAAVTALAATLTTQFPQAAGKATIQTDLADYPPDTQVNVTGSGWLASEVVQLTFTETSTTPPGGYTDGPFVFYATADGQGNIANGEFHTDQHDVGVNFLLTARGVISGRWAQTTFTDGLNTLFQIDRDATGGTSTSHDWNQVYADRSSGSQTAGTGSIQFTVDGVNSAQDDVFANSPKDTQDISLWKWWKHAVSSPKTDLEHGFAAAYQESGYPVTYGTTHTLLYIGTDRYASGSNSAISIWFLQHPIGMKADGTFVNKANGSTETHVVGDLLIQASLGSTTSVDAYKWVGGTNPLQPITLTSAQETHAINTGTISVPWAFTDKDGSSGPLAQEFFEVGLDLNEVFKTTSDNLPDFSSFIITSRTSNSQTATLSDFILGNVSSAPDVAVTKTSDAATVSAGGQVGYTVSVSNAGVGNLTGITLNDPLPAGAGADLNWSFAVGGNPGGVFQLTGSVGNQSLSFGSPQNLAFNSPALVAHVVATSSTSDLGKLHNVATVTASGEGSDFLSNNTSTADIVVVPVAVDDGYNTTLNGTLTVAAPGVRSNDGTPLSDFTSVLVSGPSHGALTFNADGSFTYTPNTGSTATDTFTYKDKDAFGNFSNTATVTITIGNDAPVANDDSYSVDEDGTLGPLGTGVLANDTDANGNSLAVAAPGTITTSHGGSVTLYADGTFTYSPAANYTGSDSFTYKATDGVANSNTATVTITVNPINDAPANVVVIGDTIDENDVADLSGSFSDGDSGDSHTVTINWGDGSTDSVISLGSGVTTFSASHPYLDDNASDSYAVSVTVKDNGGLEGSGGATVTVHNVAPIVLTSTSTIVLSPGDAFSRPGSFFDAGTLDSWTATVDYDDGNGVQPLTLTAGKTFSLTSAAYTAGVHQVTVSVTDDDGGVGTMLFYVSVGTPPAIAAVEPQTGAKNVELTHDFSFTGASNSGYAFSIYWGDASGAGNVQSGASTTDGGGNGTFNGSHTYAHKGTYTVFVTVTDSGTGVSSTISFTVTVS